MKKILTGSLVCLLLAGCSLIPGYQRPDVQPAADWKYGAATAGDQKIASDWWRAFNSPELDTFMAEALDQNNDLRAAIDRIEQARARVDIAGAALVPTLAVDGAADYTHTKSNGQHNGLTTRTWDVGPAISYELDLFGANRAATESAQETYKGSIYDQQALALTTMGDVADSYFLVVNLRERVNIAQENLKSIEEILRIVTARFEAGASSALDVSQQKTTLATAQASVSALQRQEKQAEDALAVLLGRTPEKMDVAAASLADMHIPDLAPTQPSTLLERRPDIRSAEASLLAANADIGVARADFFPSINLGAAIGLAGTSFSGPVGAAITGTSALLAPIFSGGSLEGALTQSKARKAELVEDYRKSVLTSFKEVEDALVAVKAAAERETSLKEAVTQAQRSYTLSKELYSSGAVDFETLLNAQQALLQTEDSYASVRLEWLEASVDLYKALGGGWQSEEPVTAQSVGAGKPPEPQTGGKTIAAPTAGPAKDDELKI